MRAKCIESFDLPFIIGKEYDIFVDVSNYPLTYKVEDETQELSAFTRQGLCNFFDINFKQTFKFGR